MQHYCYFNRHILNPIQRSGYVAEGRKAMLKLKEQVLDEILLRRTKTTRADDIQLPPRIVKVRRELLDEREADFYEALYTQSQAQFDTYVKSGTVLNNYAHIFDILIRLRQAVDHPYLVLFSDTKNAAGAAFATAAKSSTTSQPDESSGGQVCCVCHDPIDEEEEGSVTTAACGHAFCKPCLSDLLGTVGGAVAGSTTLCPECSQPLTISVLPSSNTSFASSAAVTAAGGVLIKRKGKSFLDKINLDQFQSSTKLEVGDVIPYTVSIKFNNLSLIAFDSLGAASGNDHHRVRHMP